MKILELVTVLRRERFWEINRPLSWAVEVGLQVGGRDHYCVIKHKLLDGRTLWSVIYHRTEYCFDLGEIHEAITDGTFVSESVFDSEKSCRAAFDALMKTVWPAQ